MPEAVHILVGREGSGMHPSRVTYGKQHDHHSARTLATESSSEWIPEVS
jgi:hypothetical protein